jgi:tetratricopeptide (TPR) repeat protein
MRSGCLGLAQARADVPGGDAEAGLVSALSANVGDGRSDLPEVWGRIPQRNKNFTGREGILEQLREGLGSDVTAVVPTALQGFGGVGKTQVAIEYAWRYAREYDLVWWISADQPVLVRSSLAALAPRLGLPSPTAAGIEDAASAVLESLRRGQPYQRWLLIFDNADLPEDIADIIPRGPYGHVLITSRNQRWDAVVKTLPVDVFSRKESVEFLRRRVPKGVSEDQAGRLADELGDLPLALEQAAALQAETGMSIEEYLRLLHEHATQLLAEGKPTEYPVSMTAAWSLSVAQLKEKLPEAIDLLRCCAFFGPEPIPRDVFVPLPDAGDDEPPETDPHHRLIIQPQLVKLLADPILLSTAIRELGRYALARIDAVSRTIQVHRLVQALVRDELSAKEQARMRHVVHVLLANASPRSPDVRPNWSRYEDLLAHADPSLVVDCPSPAVRQFCLDVVRYLYASGDMKVALSFVKRVISAWEKDSREGAERYVLVARRHQGNVLRELGDYRAAFDLNQATLERMNQVLGPSDEETLQLTTSHGADLRARGEFEKARQHDEDSLTRHELAFGVSDRRTLRAANGLALDYVLISDYQRARTLHMETYQRQRSPGSDVSPQEILASWANLARIVRLSGNYVEAVDLGEDAHAFGVHEVGAEHPWTLRTAKDLSIARRMSGATDDGLALAEDTYARALRIFGPDNPDTLAAAMNLANARRMTGRIEEGFKLAMDTMDRYPKIYGRDHPYNYGCAVNLALLRRDRGDLVEARELDQDSLAKLEASLGRRHHFTLTCALNLANDLVALGEVGAARELDQGSLVLAKELLGEDHPLVLACAANLAHDLRAGEASDRAAEVFADALARYDAVLGLEHPDTKAVREHRRLDFDFDPPPI